MDSRRAGVLDLGGLTPDLPNLLLLYESLHAFGRAHSVGEFWLLLGLVMCNQIVSQDAGQQQLSTAPGQPHTREMTHWAAFSIAQLWYFAGVKSSGSEYSCLHTYFKFPLEVSLYVVNCNLTSCVNRL